jgi:hypothetical protein
LYSAPEYSARLLSLLGQFIQLYAFGRIARGNSTPNFPLHAGQKLMASSDVPCCVAIVARQGTVMKTFSE